MEGNLFVMGYIQRLMKAIDGSFAMGSALSTTPSTSRGYAAAGTYYCYLNYNRCSRQPNSICKKNQHHYSINCIRQY